MGLKYRVYVISDSIGETAEMVARAVAEQFRDTEYEIKRYPYVTNEEQLLDIIEDASGRRSIIVITTVLTHLKDKLAHECKKAGIPLIDLLSSAVSVFSDFLGSEPAREPGIIHRLDERYFKKVEAIEFAVKYDDGKDPRGIKKADVIIIGISRTSKTPLSMYLAHKNLKVANVPLVPEVPVPDELFEIAASKIIGLTTNPYKLNEIRQERLKALGLNSQATYADLGRILEELEYSDKLMKKLGCPVIDVSNKAVEETANIILEIMKKKIDVMG